LALRHALGKPDQLPLSGFPGYAGRRRNPPPGACLYLVSNLPYRSWN
jgi:hypothetical protein